MKPIEDMQAEKSLRDAMTREIQACRRRGEDTIHSLHALIACLRTRDGEEIINAMDLPFEADEFADHNEQCIEEYCQQQANQARQSGTVATRKRRTEFASEYCRSEWEAMQIAAKRVEEKGGEWQYNAGELMLGFCLARGEEGNSTQASLFMEQAGIREDQLRELVLNPEKASEGRKKKKNKKDDRGRKPKVTALVEFGTDMNQLAEDGKIGPVIGRDLEIRHVSETLLRKTECNAMLVGPSGVGKTAIAEGVALMLSENRAPEPLKDKRLISISMGGMMAGTQFRGSFEERLKGVLEEAAENPKVILFIDEAHTIMGAGTGTSMEGTLDASNIMKPYLARGDIQMIGATTPEEYRSIERNRAMERRFTKIDVQEPSKEDTLKILEGIQESYEKHHGTEYDPKSLRACIELSEVFDPEHHRPCGPIRIMDLAGAANQIAEEPVPLLGEEHVVQIVSRTRGVPADIVRSRASGEASEDSDEERRNRHMERLRTLPDRMREEIFGQDEAIDAICAVIQQHHAGFGEEDRTVGNLLFAGPTGTGKTETARVLAKCMGMSIERFDMSEYSEEHSVSGLTGAPPGFVGYHEGRRLMECVKQNPHCVILLDEIEKAHPKVHNILLQVMSTGKLTGQDQQTANYENAIIIMTTNAGGTEAGQRSIGFQEPRRQPIGFQGDETADDRMRRDRIGRGVAKAFSPEFRNRLDRVVNFNPVSRDMALRIARKAVKEIAAQARRRNIEVRVGDGVIDLLSREGMTRDMGARPIMRVAAKILKGPMVKAQLEGELHPGYLADFRMDENGKIVMKASKIPDSAIEAKEDECR